MYHAALDHPYQEFWDVSNVSAGRLGTKHLFCMMFARLLLSPPVIQS